MAGPATDGLFAFRRDFLLIVVLVFCLRLHDKIRFNVWIFVMNLAAVITLLTYEPFVYISLPIFFLLTLYRLKERNCRHAVLCAGVLILPQILAFLLSSIFKGNADVAQSIWESIKPMYGDNCPDKIPYLIGFIGKSTADVMKLHLSINFNILSLIIQPFFFIAIYYIVINIIPTFTKKKMDAINDPPLSCILVLQFVCLLPMWLVLSCDYLRLHSYVVLSSFVIFFLIPQNVILEIIPKKATDMVDKVNGKLRKFVYPSKYVLVFLLLFITISPWYLTNSIIGHITKQLCILLWPLF